MFDLFQISGNVPVCTSALGKGLATDLLHNLIIRCDLLSCPWALLMLRSLVIFNMTSSLKENEASLVVETYCSELATVLLLIRGAHFEARKLLKQFALISKSDSSLLLVSRREITGTFFQL